MMTETELIKHLEHELEVALSEISRLRHLLALAKPYVTDPIVREIIDDAGGAI